ncbi:MAG: lysophospholipid acyltransferase family protein [Bdellovibrionota bacterium]
MIRDMFSNVLAGAFAKTQSPEFQEFTSLLEESTRGANHAGNIIARATKYIARTSMTAMQIKDEVVLRRKLIQIVGEESHGAVSALGYDLKIVGYDKQMMKENNFLMVGNHVSYMDILMLAGVQPALFVTSVDMGQAPLLGQITRLAGCIFVERRNRTQVGRDLGTISDALKQDFNVMIYPEGTSSNGMQVLPFKKSLLMAAVEADKDILPVCIKYTEIDGEPFSAANADKVCWYGDMTFGPHFLGMMKLKSLKAELHFLKPIKVTKESSRADLTEQAYEAISACYNEGRDLVPV